MTHRFTRLLATALMVLTPVAGVVHADPMAGKNLSRLLTGVSTLSASFEQVVLDGGGTRLQRSEGDLVLARPGKFRWRTDEPFPQLLVSNGQTLWIYDQDLEQVTQQAVDQRLTNTPALLLSGDLQSLQQSFNIDGPADGESGLYRLQPIDQDAMFVILRILFEDGVPMEMQLEDNLGQKTSLYFSDLQLNTEIDEKLFEFQVPDGVDLITE